MSHHLKPEPVIPILLGDKERERENKEDDMKIIREMDVGGWDEDSIAKKRECVSETEWDLIGGWMDRQDDERGPRQKKRSLIDPNQAKKMGHRKPSW